MLVLRQRDPFTDLAARIPWWGWALLAVVAGLSILAVGMRPGSDLAAMPVLPRGSDKVLHFVAYACLATCVFRAIYPFSAWSAPRLERLPWLWVVAVPSVVGMLDEFLQGMLAAGRSQDVYDWLADTMGGVFVCVVGLMSRYRARADAPIRQMGRKR